MDTPAAAGVIEGDLGVGAEIGVRGTPALFINRRRVPGGAVPYAYLAAIVEREIKQCQGTRN